MGLTVCVTDPVAVTVTVAVPVPPLLFPGDDSVNVLVTLPLAGTVTGLGESAHDGGFEIPVMLQVRVTGPLNPFTEVKVIVAVDESLRCDIGSFENAEAVIVKSCTFCPPLSVPVLVLKLASPL